MNRTDLILGLVITNALVRPIVAVKTQSLMYQLQTTLSVESRLVH